MRNPEDDDRVCAECWEGLPAIVRETLLACDWCGANGEGVAADDDRICAECWEGFPAIVRATLLACDWCGDEGANGEGVAALDRAMA